MIQPRCAVPVAAVAAHYDGLDQFYREIWGEHLHHGLWRTGRETPEQAVLSLLDLVAMRLNLALDHAVCDIGCGYGATGHYLAERHGARVTGLTISAAQSSLGAARRPSRGSLDIRRQDWLANDLADTSFDRALAIESSEHMADKGRFFAEAFRVLRPGGRLVVCAWLARADARPWEVRWLLEPICREGRLPGMGEEADYRRLAGAAGFTLASCEDLSARVRRTWWVCTSRVAARLATDRRYRRFLMDRHAGERVFALTLLRLLLAYRTGSMRYVLLAFERPGPPVSPARQRHCSARS